MNGFLAAAAVLTFLTGLVHTVLGETRIFPRMRTNGEVIPTSGGDLLLARHVRILWGTWHLVTACAWALAAILWWLGLQGDDAPAAVGLAVIGGLAASSLLVVVATKGKHPGWIALLGAAILTALGLWL